MGNILNHYSLDSMVQCLRDEWWRENIFPLLLSQTHESRFNFAFELASPLFQHEHVRLGQKERSKHSYQEKKLSIHHCSAFLGTAIDSIRFVNFYRISRNLEIRWPKSFWFRDRYRFQTSLRVSSVGILRKPELSWNGQKEYSAKEQAGKIFIFGRCT